MLLLPHSSKNANPQWPLLFATLFDQVLLLVRHAPNPNQMLWLAMFLSKRVPVTGFPWPWTRNPPPWKPFATFPRGTLSSAFDTHSFSSSTPLASVLSLLS